jgi:bifunctional DNA-binding transcriptional regulator/antitoxin component of YhaV-PrlF toxin-antitoxin module
LTKLGGAISVVWYIASTMPPEHKSVKITKKGQVTIPKEFRDALTVERRGHPLRITGGREGDFLKASHSTAGNPLGGRSYQDLLKALEWARTGWR